MTKFNNKIQDVKRAQKESFLLREVSTLFLRIALEDKLLHDFYVTRVELSPDKGWCTVFFHTARGFDFFNEHISHLISYKPSLRTALSKSLQSRYTPDLKFAYDQGVDKQNRMEEIFERLKDEGKL